MTRAKEISNLDELASLVGTELAIVSKEVNGVPTAYRVPVSEFGGGAGVTFATSAEIDAGASTTKALNPFQFKDWIDSYFKGAAFGNSQVVETNGSGKLISAAKGTAYNKAFGVYTDIATGTSEVLVLNPKSVSVWWSTSILGAALGNSEVLETNGSGKIISVAKATGYNKAFSNAAEINTGTETAKVVSPAIIKSWFDTYVVDTLGNSQVVETTSGGLLTSVAKGTAYNKAFGVAADINTGTSEVLVLNPKSVKDWFGTYVKSGTYNVSSVVLTDGSGLLTTATINSAHNKAFSSEANVNDDTNETTVINPKRLYYFLSGVTLSNEGTGSIGLFKAKTGRNIEFYNIDISGESRLSASLGGDDYALSLVTPSKFASFTSSINNTYFNTTPTASYPAAGFQFDHFSKRFSLRGSVVAIDAIPAGTTLFTLGASYRPNTDLYCMLSKFDTTMTTHTMIPVKVTATTGVVTNLIAITSADKVFLDSFTFVLDNDLV